MPSFNTQPPEGGWQISGQSGRQPLEFQHTAARRRLAFACGRVIRRNAVSTHSRPKAAGRQNPSEHCRPCFNTQPPEGGWAQAACTPAAPYRFNTQPPEGGWDRDEGWGADLTVSTHSRPKAAGLYLYPHTVTTFVSTHSRPKAAVPVMAAALAPPPVSTHSRPKAAGH